MLRLRRIEISNFALFDHIVVEPSIDPDRPLTVIRAANGSGKTTFLRALRWGMYSEKGLPADSARFSLHPAGWTPDDDGIKTEVTIEFETDGSTRYTADGAATTTTYRLSRSVTTIGRVAASDSEPDFRRINDQAQLMVKEGDGTWAPHTAGVDLVIEQLLPWDLRDFFVMDADEAADFVGGSENKVISRKAVAEKTTAAVHSLLGIDVFQQASKRISGIGMAFGAAATKAIGDADLDELQQELEQLREEHADLDEKLKEDRTQRDELNDKLERRQDDLETELKDVGAAEELETRLKENRARLERAKKGRATSISLLARELESTELLAHLARESVNRAYATLKPLYDQGHIPLKHVTFVRGLLASGTCVCGQDLTDDGIHRRHVEDLIRESADQEERANYLGQLHDAAKSMAAHAAERQWPSKTAGLAIEVDENDQEYEQAKLEDKAIQAKLDSIDQEHIQIIRDEIAALKTRLTDLSSSINLRTPKLDPLSSKIDSLGKQIHQRQRNERAASDQRAAESLAELAGQVLNRAYATIQNEQVSDLSKRMNRLFAHMVANVSENDFDEKQRNKASVRMIAEVGVRPLESNPDQFEIYALNSRRRAMPPIEINGASRRVLALSFVLALCTESKTHAPLIADSLLNFMSGAVRRNTLAATCANSSQPILLLTPADLEAQSEVDTVQQFAGATYTLTAQWDAVDPGAGGDVVNQTSQEQISEICKCGARSYCDLCERTGQAGAPGWTKQQRETSQ